MRTQWTGRYRFTHMEPILILNPRDDVEFAALAARLLEPGAVPAALESRLREYHPQAVVRRRGLSGEQPEAWYVYRDGKWTPSRPVP